ncbi:hypothetical protein R3P38DRAFT_2841081 [Favolaschia claudopus]|uniref:Uncharacterized protein n=1 Tax=Favolaschia claudopus TaxID=2862362 RepID=A0AAW0DWV4_9AGAR
MHLLADQPAPLIVKDSPLGYALIFLGAPVRDFRGEVVGGHVDAPSSPTGNYQDCILEVAASLTDDNASSPHQFYDLWELILMHWFPENEGYRIEHQWSIPYLEDSEGAADITFVVLDAGNPVVLLQLSAPSLHRNAYTRAAAQELSVSHFEHVAPYCTNDYPLCAITAMGKNWMGFHRSPNLTGFEAQSLGEEQRIEWMEDIVSEVSYEMIECFFCSLKEAVRVHRIATRS